MSRTYSISIEKTALKEFLKDLIENFDKYSDTLILNYDKNIDRISNEILKDITEEERKALIKTLESYSTEPPNLSKAFVSDKDVQILKKIADIYEGSGVRIPSKGEKVLLGLILYKDLISKKEKKFDLEDIGALTSLLGDTLYIFWMYKEGFLEEHKLKNYLKSLLKEGLNSSKNPQWVKKQFFNYLIPVWAGLEERTSVIEELSKKDLEEKSEELAKEIIFENEENFQKTVEIMEEIFRDFVKEKPKDVDTWIKKEIKKFEEKSENKKKEGNPTLKNGFDYGATTTQVNKIENLDSYINEVNERLKNKFSTIKDNPALHGNVAEHYHAETFNINAKIQGKPYKAVVLENNTANSVDIAIKDSEGSILNRYQSKYYKTPEGTAKALTEGNYRGQKPLVPSDQLEEVNKIRASQNRSSATDRLEYDDVSSQPLSREEAEKIKNEIRKRNDILSYENVSFKAAFKGIVKDAGKVLTFVLAVKGAFRLGNVLIEKIKGKDVSFSKELEKFVKHDLKDAANSAIKTIITGGLLIAARKGFIKILQNTPAGKIASIVEIGFRVFSHGKRLFKGKISFGQFLKESKKEIAGVMGGIYGAVKGAAIGAAMGSYIPIIGNLVGGMIGAIVGGIAGETITKKATEFITDKVEKAYNKVKETVKTIGNTIKEGAKALINFIFR